MLKLFRRMMPREDRFFDLFERHARIVLEGAHAMNGLLEGGPRTQTFCAEIYAREHEADEVAREVLQTLRRSFITPFDRNDIADLIQSLDDSIDQMNKTAKSVTLFELTSFTPQMREMGALIVEAATLTLEAIPLLENVATHQAKLGELTERVTQVESRSDDLHDQGLKELVRAVGQGNAMDYIIGADIYGNLEKVVDRFEDVANEISGVVIENI